MRGEPYALVEFAVPVALATANGDVVGSLCIVDQRPIEIDAIGLGKLMRTADMVAKTLEAGAKRRR